MQRCIIINVTGLLAVAMAALPLAHPRAQLHVTFQSIGDGRKGQADPRVDGNLFRPAGDTGHPALVFLHGCGGLIGQSGRINAREADWARRMTGPGYVVLAVDSFTTRHQGQECAPDAPRHVTPSFDRVHDAYAALGYLRRQGFVDAARIGVIGWSRGGETVLSALNDAALFGLGGERGFRAAVAFYPAGCDADAWSRPGSSRLDWTTPAPLLVLFGGSDNWRSAGACQRFVTAADRQGAPVQIHVYPGASDDFDWPNVSRRGLPAFTPVGSNAAPIVATEPAARADAFGRVSRFLATALQHQRG
jgi:dienelactone hydrolase